MHNRDGLDTLWPGQFTAEQNAEWPAEYLVKIADGSNFGWPYCFYNNAEGKLVTNPEYGGDGKKTDRCARSRRRRSHSPGTGRRTTCCSTRAHSFPAVSGRRVRRVPRIVEPRAAADGRLQHHVRAIRGRQARENEVFADGFMGKPPLMRPNEAVARPGGLAMAPDGSLYIAEDVKGKVWRIMYKK